MEGGISLHTYVESFFFYSLKTANPLSSKNIEYIIYTRNPPLFLSTPSKATRTSMHFIISVKIIFSDEK